MESTFSQAMHALSLATTLTILGVILKEHKVWIRLKDRVDTLWFHHTKQTGEPFQRIDNGH